MRHPSLLILILAAVLALPLVARGESTPVTQPWSLLGQVPVVLRFTPQIAAPVTALRARLVLQGVNVSNLELLSITGLPQVLEVAASLGTLTAWELLLGAPLAKDVEVTLLLRLQLHPDALT
ncbi:unnamed protein product [Symbiodinium microadriaticum]|nr:unnamed protein product [Symbiodinium microadriaticum]CAE7913676.1 unnamed protein product [Symbiodinium sp. KB8]